MMRRTLLATIVTGLAATAVTAQKYPLRTVDAIQSVSAARLSNCDDAANFLGETVTVKGIVLVKGGEAQASGAQQIWIRDVAGDGPYRNIAVRFESHDPRVTTTSPASLNDLNAGDIVEITAVVEEFSATLNSDDGETVLNPIENGVWVTGNKTGADPQPAVINNLGLLNNSFKENQLATGEAYEGNFVKLQNVTVVAVNTAGNRVSFTVADANGNLVVVSDRFLAQRTSAATPAGNFTVPAIGDQFTSLSGIVIHSKNNCGNSTASSQGYTLNPFDESHYVQGAITQITGAASTSNDVRVFPSPTLSSRQVTIKYAKLKGKGKKGRGDDDDDDNSGSNSGSGNGLTDVGDNCNCEWRGVPFTVVDLMGQPTDISGFITEEETCVDLSDLNAGYYSIILQTPTGNVTQSVIVQ